MKKKIEKLLIVILSWALFGCASQFVSSEERDKFCDNVCMSAFREYGAYDYHWDTAEYKLAKMQAGQLYVDCLNCKECVIKKDMTLSKDYVKHKKQFSE